MRQKNPAHYTRNSYTVLGLYPMLILPDETMGMAQPSHVAIVIPRNGMVIMVIMVLGQTYQIPSGNFLHPSRNSWFKQLENGDFPIKNGDFPIKNGDLPS